MSKDFIKKIKKRIKDKEIFIVEGEKFIREALFENSFENSFEIEFIAALKDFTAPGQNVLKLSEKDFKALSDAKTPQGVLALVRRKKFEPEQIKTPTIIIGENIQDPGNVGTLIRSAAAFGASAVFTKNSADIFGAKTVRASAGSVFHTPVADGIEIKTALSHFKSRGYKIYAAAPKGGKNFFERGKTVILIGNESAGLSKEAQEQSDETITIPAPGKAESLNAAAAGAILLYEAYKTNL